MNEINLQLLVKKVGGGVDTDRRPGVWRANIQIIYQLGPALDVPNWTSCPTKQEERAFFCGIKKENGGFLPGWC